MSGVQNIPIIPQRTQKPPARKAMMKLTDAKLYENKVNTKNAAALPVR